MNKSLQRFTWLSNALSFAGRNGPVMLFAGVFLGLLLPELADAARPRMGAAVFAFTLGAFLKVDFAALQLQATQPRRLAWVLLWTTLGVPLVAWLLLGLLPVPAGTRTGLLLCMLAPPVGSAAAMAAMLRLNPALALAGTVIASLLSPFLLPPAAAALGGIELQIDATGLMLRLAWLVVGAATAATLLRRFAGTFVRETPQAMTGVAVLGLIVVAIGAMHGVQPQLRLHGHAVAAALVTAFACNAGFWALGALLFAKLGRTDALTVGLLSGNRNVTLVWVAATPWLAGLPEVELYVAASVFPIFMLPLPMARLLAWWERRRPVVPPAELQRRV